MSKVMLSIEGTPEELARVLALIGGADISVCACTKQEFHPMMEMPNVAPSPEAQAEEKPKRTRRTKAEIEADRLAADREELRAKADMESAEGIHGPDSPEMREAQAKHAEATRKLDEAEKAASQTKEVTVEEVRALLVELGKATDGTSAAAKAIIKEQTGKDAFAAVTKDELPALKAAVEMAVAAAQKKAA